MRMFLDTLIRCSVAMSVISLVYLVAMPLLSKRYSAKWLYYIWLVVVIGWAFPFRSHLHTNLFLFHIPEIQTIQAKYIGVAEPIKIINSGTRGTSSISLWGVIASIWAICTIAMIAYNGWRHWRFLKMVNRWSEYITNRETLDVLDTLRRKMRIQTHVGVKTCHGISSPMMIGFFRHTILLPSIEIDLLELTFILRHELVHLKRKDLWYKALVLLATAVHWFNPIVYIMGKAIAVQCEISCDELLVKEESLQQRKQYGQTLIDLVRSGTRLQTSLLTDFYSEGKAIKTRIFYIMDTTKKKAGITILCAAFLSIIGSGMIFASSSAKNESDNNIKHTQIINVDIKTLERGKFVCFGGPYKLEEGDLIKYELATEGNNENLLIKLFRDDNKASNGNWPLQVLTLMNSCIPNSDHQVKITQSQAGSYCLFFENDGGVDQSNLKGTIEIIKGKENDVSWKRRLIGGSSFMVLG